MKIQPVLDSCEVQMEHLQSPQLRSENLLSLLRIERENNKNIDLLNKNYTAAQMSSDMDKNELRHQLNYAIILLTDYQKTQTLSVAEPSSAYSKEFAARLNSIKDGIDSIINKYQPDQS